MAQSATGIAAGFMRAALVRIALADELRALGRSPLPQRLVDEHKRDALKEQRVAWRVIRQIARTLCLLQLLLWLQRSFPIRIPFIAFGTIAILVGVVALLEASVVLRDEHPVLAILACIPAVALVTALCLDQMPEWVTVRLDDRLEGHLLGGAALRVPQHLRKRAREAASLDKVRLEVDAIGEDPILYASRGWLWRAERVPIGAWETDTILDRL